MSKQLTIQGTTYNYPINGDDPQWGEDAVAWAEAVTEALALLLGPDDILPRAATILNDQASPQLIRGFFFNPVTVRAANIQYTIYRTTDDSTIVENGEMLLNYNATAGVGEKWKISQDSSGDALTLLTVTDDGQFYYTSSDLTGANYSGTIKFQAKALTNT